MTRTKLSGRGARDRLCVLLSAVNSLEKSLTSSDRVVLAKIESGAPSLLADSFDGVTISVNASMLSNLIAAHSEFTDAIKHRELRAEAQRAAKKQVDLIPKSGEVNHA